ncbi:MAG TPA: phage portal protein [Actinoallomurus sp.]|nr:phage portal protein [Actinoallomurus sp.]
MGSVLDRVDARRRGVTVERKQFSEPPFWQLNALRHALVGSWAPDKETIDHDFEGYAAGAGKAAGPVFACHYARLRVFVDGQFLWRDREKGQLGAFYDSPDLQALRRPWPGSKLTNLLAWMEVDATYAGNSYVTWCDDFGRYGAAAAGPTRRLARLRPDWVTLVLGSHSDDPYALDTKVIGVLYEPTYATTVTGATELRKPVLLLPSEVCHYAPVPDPIARFRGMSWLTPVLREISSDRAATELKVKRFQNGAALQTVVSLDKDVTPENFQQFVQLFREGHEGPENAYKTLFMGGGADVTIVGADMKQLEFKAIQGAGETRIAAAAGVHPVVVGLSEGLSGSSLNAGNYSAARRNVADGTLNHLWTEAGNSLEVLFPRPKPTAELCIDKRDVSFVREDQKDIAEIKFRDSQTIRNFLDAGWTPESVKAAVAADDWSLLEHSGLFSVQLQKPGSGTPTDPNAGGDQ